jgi:hypothetical protein
VSGVPITDDRDLRQVVGELPEFVCGEPDVDRAEVLGEVMRVGWCRGWGR